MKNYTFRTIINPVDKNTYHGYVPSLPGCHTWGKTIEETRANLDDAIKCHIQGILLDKESIPEEGNSFESLHVFSEQDLYSDISAPGNA